MKVISVILSTLIICFTTGTFVATKYLLNSLHGVSLHNLDKQNSDIALPNEFNMLILATDNRDGISRSTLNRLHAGGEGCKCTDSMLYVHVSFSNNRIQAISIPRDTFVRLNIPSKGIYNMKSKINAAYQYGADASIDAVKSLDDNININHLVEVNFIQFVTIVDKIGGVDMEIPHAINDTKSGLHVESGMQHMDGAKALAYSRARYFDGQGDIGRMSRQHAMLMAIIKKITSGTNVKNNIDVVSSLLRSVVVDDTFKAMLSSPDVAISLLNKIKKISDNNGIEMGTLPIIPGGQKMNGLGDVVIKDDAKSAQVFRAINNNTTLNGIIPLTGINGDTGTSNSEVTANANKKTFERNQ